jgi:hypothetical protein
LNEREREKETERERVRMNGVQRERENGQRKREREAGVVRAVCVGPNERRKGSGFSSGRMSGRCIRRGRWSGSFRPSLLRRRRNGEADRPGAGAEVDGEREREKRERVTRREREREVGTREGGNSPIGLVWRRRRMRRGSRVMIQ